MPWQYCSDPFSPQDGMMVPVSGHWSRRSLRATLSKVGLPRIVCSDIREKPISSPPQAAKMTSKPMKTMTSMFGMLAVVLLGSREPSSWSCRQRNQRPQWQKAGRLERVEVVCRQSRPAGSRRTTIRALPLRWMLDREDRRLNEIEL